ISEASFMTKKFVCGALVFCLVLWFGIPARAQRPTNLTVNPVIGTYGGTTSLQATLNSTGRPVPNQTISFALNGNDVGSATTNSSGVAALTGVNLSGIAANTYTNGIAAVFDGTWNLRRVQRTATLTVSPAPASVTPNAAGKTFGANDPALTGTLSGFLASDGVTADYIRTPGNTVEGSPYTISAILTPTGVLSNYS